MLKDYSLALAFFFSLAPLMIRLKSNTGIASGKSTEPSIIASNKYHPAMDAAKKHAPASTSKLPPATRLPALRFQNAPVARPKPVVAARKTRTKTAFVRSEQMRYMAERRVIESV